MMPLQKLRMSTPNELTMEAMSFSGLLKLGNVIPDINI